MVTHDPKQIVRGLQKILINKEKNIGFLFGAGTSYALKNNASDKSRIPLVSVMTKIVIDSITDKKFKKAIEQIQSDFKKSNKSFNVEYLLSHITQIENIIGEGEFYKLKIDDIKELRKQVENKIVELVSVHKNSKDFIEGMIHVDFANWILNASRSHAIEIFTTNYDYLLEIGFEKVNLPYFDGFIGSYEPFFDSNAVEDYKVMIPFTKLWKLHGSLGWKINDETKKITRTYPESDARIIFPSYLKYDDSKKQPYVSYMDRLSSFIKKKDSVLFVCGYSFSDEHINDILLNSILNSNSSHIIFFLYDKIIKEDKTIEYFLPNCKLCQVALSNPNISVYGMKHAITGRQLGEWKKLQKEPDNDESIEIDSYFEPDFAVNSDAELKKEYTKEEIASFTGSGEFKLPNFAAFVEFLKKEVMPEDYVKKVAGLFKKSIGTNE